MPFNLVVGDLRHLPRSVPHHAFRSTFRVVDVLEIHWSGRDAPSLRYSATAACGAEHQSSCKIASLVPRVTSSVWATLWTETSEIVALVASLLGNTALREQ